MSATITDLRMPPLDGCPSDREFGARIADLMATASAKTPSRSASGLINRVIDAAADAGFGFVIRRLEVTSYRLTTTLEQIHGRPVPASTRGRHIRYLMTRKLRRASTAVSPVPSVRPAKPAVAQPQVAELMAAASAILTAPAKPKPKRRTRVRSAAQIAEERAMIAETVSMPAALTRPGVDEAFLEIDFHTAGYLAVRLTGPSSSLIAPLTSDECRQTAQELIDKSDRLKDGRDFSGV